VIKRFGGLRHAAAAFSGQSGKILKTLVDDTKTLREIQSACGLGAAELSSDGYLEQIDQMCVMSSERMKRIARRRFSEYAFRMSPENRRLRSLLEYWADRKVVARRWKLGPCQRCGQHEFVEYLDIRKRILCANCGQRISIPASVPIGYTLPRPVNLAIIEGIIPVALTGRFLRNMTHSGFMWLPGAKYQLDKRAGDIDVLACCDGHLVFAECKCLEHTKLDASVWPAVVDQFLQTAVVARKCNAAVVVLSSLVDEYPPDVTGRIGKELGDTIAYLILNRADLERGSGRVSEGESQWPLTIGQLIRDPFAERQKAKGGIPRTINFGCGTFSRA
jgi:hypothetical protein